MTSGSAQRHPRATDGEGTWRAAYPERIDRATTLRLRKRHRQSFYNLLRRSYRSEEQMAAALGWPVADIQHEAEAGRLLVIEMPWGRYFPKWQVWEGDLLPHLGELLGSFPPGTRPSAIDRWAHTHMHDLELDGRPASPLVWLRTGGEFGRLTGLIPATAEDCNLGTPGGVHASPQASDETEPSRAA